MFALREGCEIQSFNLKRKLGQGEKLNKKACCNCNVGLNFPPSKEIARSCLQQQIRIQRHIFDFKKEAYVCIPAVFRETIKEMVHKYQIRSSFFGLIGCFPIDIHFQAA